MKHRKLFITFTAIFTALVAIAIFLLVWFCGDSYPDFDEFRPSVAIPGLKDGAVPQGIASYNGDYSYTEGEEEKTAKQDYYFISSYMKKGPSRLYVTGSKTDDTVFVFKTDKESGYTNAADEIIDKSQKPEGENFITFTTSFAANCNASFCFYYDAPQSVLDKLYVGEFYREKNYPTAESHHVTTKISQTENRAFVYEYSVTTSSSNKYGLEMISSSENLSEDSRVPEIKYIYSVTDEIQGFARTEKSLVLSRSWGLKNSTLYYHDWDKIHPSTGSSNFSGKVSLVYDGIKTKNGNSYVKEITTYYVDESSLIREYSIPSMAEGLCVADNKVQVLFESASYKYNKFVRCQLKDVYAFTPRKK